MNLRILLALFAWAMPATLPVVAGVVLNEIFYHAPDDLDDLEWIEFHNPDSAPVDLSGWSLSKGVDYRFPAETVLAPRGYWLICKNRTLFAEYYPGVTINGEFKGSLSNGGETLELVDAQQRSVDRVTYRDEAPWPTSADGLASSLERITPNAAGDLAQNWSASPLPDDNEFPAGTPGKANASYSLHLPPIITELQVTPSTPSPGQAVKVSVLVRDPKGVTQVEVRYQIARPGKVSSESAVPMVASEGDRYTGEIPGAEAGSLLRIRVRAVNTEKAERQHPSPNEVQPTVGVFVQSPPALAQIPLAQILNFDPRELALIERLRVQAQKPGRGGFGDQETRQLQEMVATGFDVSGAWFEWSIRRPVDLATYRALRPVFQALDRKAALIQEEILSDPSPSSQIPKVPARVREFRDQIQSKVRPLLPPDLNAPFETWFANWGKNPASEGPTFFRQLLNAEGTWLALNAAVELKAEQLERLKPALIATVTGRDEVTAKIMRGELDFGKLFDALGVLSKRLDQELLPILSVRERRALADWKSAQGSPIRPRLGVAPAKRPRGSSALVVTDPRSGSSQVFDYIHVTERSAGYRIRFQNRQPWNGMSTAAFIFEYNDRFVLAEPLSFDLYRRLGNPACQTDFVRLALNGHMAGYHLVVEQVNAAFLRRNRLDTDGDLYKILWYGTGVEGQHEKQNHPDHDYARLNQLLESLASTQGNAQWDVIQKNFDVPNVIDYFALNTVLSHWDGFFNNYFTYRGPDTDPRWRLFPWDQDKTWGFHDSSGDQIFFDMPLSFGMKGDRPPGGGEPRVDPRHWWRPPGYFSGPLLANPEFRSRFLKRLRQILEETYTENTMFPVIDALVGKLKPEIPIRAQAIGEPPEQALSRLEKNAASLKEHLVKRRQFLLQQRELVDLTR